jgi:ATP-dependent exoDNAse (exonuclease V) alpha subunit
LNTLHGKAGMQRVTRRAFIRMHHGSLGDAGALALAYCLTVHKAQDSQFRRILMPVFRSRILDRSLLYTALTRATQQVVLVGDRRAFAVAVAAAPVSERRETALGTMLEGILRPAVSRLSAGDHADLIRVRDAR